MQQFSLKLLLMKNCLFESIWLSAIQSETSQRQISENLRMKNNYMAGCHKSKAEKYVYVFL